MASYAEEVGRGQRIQTRGAGQREHVQDRHGCVCGRAAGSLMDLKAVCQANQL